MIFTRLIALLALAASLPLSEAKAIQFDVWAPHITQPTADTTWYGGTYQTVTWDASNPPSQITNPSGVLYLVVDGLIQFQDELAWDFSILDGEVGFYVPDVLTGSYQVVLFGDSGDTSPTFTIIHQ